MQKNTTKPTYSLKKNPTKLLELQWKYIENWDVVLLNPYAKKPWRKNLSSE